MKNGWLRRGVSLVLAVSLLLSHLPAESYALTAEEETQTTEIAEESAVPETTARLSKEEEVAPFTTTAEETMPETMSVGVVPANAAAAETIVTSGRCGDNLTWALNGDGILVISGTGQMSEFEYMNAPWHIYEEQISEIYIEDGVETISECAFAQLTQLRYVVLPASITSIGWGAFLPGYVYVGFQYDGCEHQWSNIVGDDVILGDDALEQGLLYCVEYTEEIDEEVWPTCTETGLTEGYHCSVCGEVLLEQEIIPELGHAFEDYYFNGDATCIEDGTMTADCANGCGATDTQTADGSAVGNTEELDEEVWPTCTETGLTEGYHCSVCQEVLLEQESIPALGHDLIAYEAQEVTCEAIGWDTYEVCCVCDYSTYAEIPALGHDEIFHEAQLPTKTTIGWEAYTTCARCEYTTYAELPALGVPVDETHFPDENFRSYVQENIDSDGDHSLSPEEIAWVTSIEVGGQNISSLHGVEWFSELDYLYCRYNQLTSLDLTHNAKLAYLDCDNNQLTSLDLTGNTKLAVLYCNSNLLTGLDLSKCTALRQLSCSNNQLMELDVSYCPSLEELFYGGNQLTHLDFSQNPNLSWFSGSEQSVTITVSKDMTFALSQWAGFDAARVTAAQNAVLEGDILRVNGAPTVTYTYDVDGDTGNRTAEFIVKVAYPASLNVTINEITFPDIIFRTHVQEKYDINTDGCLSPVEVANVTWISVTGSYEENNGITSLEGISYFYNLTSLECGYNQLTSLDVSRNTELRYLDCDNNQLTSLDISGCKKLTHLNCNDNQIAALDVSSNTSLTWLWCWGNALTSLDISKNTALTTFSCSIQTPGAMVSEDMTLGPAQLPGLDLNRVSGLHGYCDGEKITIVPETDTIQSDGYSKICYIYDVDGEAGNKTMSVTLTLEYPRSLYIPIDKAHFPDQYFREELAYRETEYYHYGADDDNDGYLSPVECANVTSLYFYDSKISDLTGIAYFPRLKRLECWNSRLVTLDVSQNTRLESLTVPNNRLSSLILGQQPNLKSLGCGENRLTELNLAGCTVLTNLNCGSNKLTELVLPSNLTSLSCQENQLTELDVRGQEKLETLDCGNNDLTMLDLSGCVALKDISCGYNRLAELQISGPENLEKLECWNNQLTQLELSDCRELTYLDCGGNQLTELDVSDCENLERLFCYGNLLQQLDVADCIWLEYLGCGENRISSLTLPNPEDCSLTELDCSNNALTHLNLDDYSLDGFNAWSQSVEIDVDRKGKFDLSTIPGFDVDRMTVDWGGTVTGSVLTVKSDCDEVYYFYNAGGDTGADAMSVCFSVQYHDSPQLILTEEQIPDTVLRNYLQQIADTNSNGTLSTQEIRNINSLTLTGLEISNFDGLELFPNIHELYCADMGLTSLNLGAFKNLSILDCSGNALSYLDLTAQKYLHQLNVSRNPMIRLDVSGQAYLYQLIAEDTLLTSLDLGNNKNLEDVSVDNNGCTILLREDRTFDLSNLPGFDVAKASDWVGGSVNGKILTVEPDVQAVTYVYDMDGSAGDWEETFTLTIDASLAPDWRLSTNSINLEVYQSSGTVIRVEGDSINGVRAYLADTTGKFISDFVLTNDGDCLRLTFAEDLAQQVIDKNKTLSGKYTVQVMLQRQGQIPLNVGKLTINIKKTLPKVTANTLKINSIYGKQTLPYTLKISGGELGFVELNEAKDSAKDNAKNWLSLNENGTVTFDGKVSGTKDTGSGKLYLKVWCTGYTVPVEVTLTISVSKTMPTMSLKAMGTIDLSNLDDTAVTLLPTYKNHIGVPEILGVKIVDGKKVDVTDHFNFGDNYLTISAAEGLIPGTYTATVKALINGSVEVQKGVRITVKRTAIATKLTTTSGKLSFDYADSLFVSYSFSAKNVDFPQRPVVTIMDKTGKVVFDNGMEPVSLELNGNTYRIRLTNKAVAGQTYKILFTAGAGHKAATYTVTVQKTGAKVTPKLVAKGHIDVIRKDSFILLTPNYGSINCPDLEIFTLKLKGTKKGEDDVYDTVTLDTDGNFFHIEDNGDGTFRLFGNGNVDHSYKWTVNMEAQVLKGNETEIMTLSKTVNLTVKMGAAKFQAVDEAGQKLTQLRIGETFALASMSNDLNAFAKVEVKDTAKDMIPYTVEQVGLDTYRIVLEEGDFFKAMNITLNIYLNGNLAEDANGCLKVNGTVALKIVP